MPRANSRTPKTIRIVFCIVRGAVPGPAYDSSAKW